MICKPCGDAADYQKRWNPQGENDRNHIGHSVCKGCDCQHRPVKRESGGEVRASVSH